MNIETLDQELQLPSNILTLPLNQEKRPSPAPGQGEELELIKVGIPALKLHDVFVSLVVSPSHTDNKLIFYQYETVPK